MKRKLSQHDSYEQIFQKEGDATPRVHYISGSGFKFLSLQLRKLIIKNFIGDGLYEKT